MTFDSQREAVFDVIQNGDAYIAAAGLGFDPTGYDIVVHESSCEGDEVGDGCTCLTTILHHGHEPGECEVEV